MKKAKEVSALRCQGWDSANRTQAPLPPGSSLDPVHGKHQWETGRWRGEACALWGPFLQQLQRVPTLGWPFCDLTVAARWPTPRMLPKLCHALQGLCPKHTRHLPGRFWSYHLFPFVASVLGVVAASCSYMSLGYLRVHFFARSASLHSCNKFPILNQLPEIPRMASVCWLDPGLVGQWDWKVKRENAPGFAVSLRLL